MTLSKEEIEMMAELISFAKEFALRGWIAGLSNGFNNGKFGHSMGEPSREKFLENLKIDTTKYLLQLKAERERAGKLMEALGLAKQYFDDREDCDYQGDPLEPIPNYEMIMLSEIQTAINGYNKQP